MDEKHFSHEELDRLEELSRDLHRTLAEIMRIAICKPNQRHLSDSVLTAAFFLRTLADRQVAGAFMHAINLTPNDMADALVFLGASASKTSTCTETGPPPDTQTH